MDWLRGRARTVIAFTLTALMAAGPIPSSLALAQEAGATPARGETWEQVSYASPDEVALVAAADDAGEKKGELTIGADKPSRTNNSLPLLKSAVFEFVKAVFPIMSWKDDDGFDVYAVGIEKKAKAQWKDIVNKKTTVWDSATRKHRDKGKSSAKFKAYLTADALYKDKPGNPQGEAAVLVGLSGKVEGQYFIFTGEASFNGMAGMRAPFSYSAQNGGSLGASLILHGSFTPKIAGGLGVKRVGRFGVYGTGTLEGEGQVLPKESADWNYLRLKAAIGLELVVFKWRPWHKDLWNTKNPIDLITPRAPLKGQSEEGPLGPYLEAQDEGEVDFVPIVAETVSGEWCGDKDVWVAYPYVPDADEQEEGDTYDESYMSAQMSTPQRGMRLLQRNVNPDAQVELVSVPGGAVMCWLESVSTDSNPMNNTRLMWSRYDAATDTWSASKRVCKAETADFEPDLFADAAGNVHVAWLNAETVIPASASKLQDATSRLNVSYARLDAGAPEFGAPERVAAVDPSSPYFRTSPEVAADGGKVVVGWSTARVDHLLDMDGDHEVVVSKGSPRADGTHVWSAETVPYASDFEICSLDAGMLGTEPCVAWTFDDLESDAAGTVTSGPRVPTLELVCHSGQKREVRDATNADFAQQGATGVLTWSTPAADGTQSLRMLSGASAEPRTLMEDVSLPPNYQVDGDLAREALITYAQWESGDTFDESSTDVFGRVLTSGTKMSDEALLVAHTDDLTSHDVAFVGGEPLVACAAERGIGGGQDAGDGLQAQAQEVRSADLLVARADSLERLQVTDLLYDTAQVAPGAIVPMYVTVSNEGLATIRGGVCAQIVDDTTGAVLGSGSYDQPIAVGAEVDIPVTVRVPFDFDPRSCHALSVKANFQGVRAEDSYALNLDTFLMGPAYDPDYIPVDPSVPVVPVTPVWPSGPQAGSYVSSYGGWGYANTSHASGSSSASSTSTTTSVASAAGRVARRSGADRYDTMAQTVSSAFPASDWAVVASGEGYADALAALSLAGAHEAPVILTARDVLSPQARSELARLGCTHVIVAGGPAAVSDAVVGELKGIAGDVVRVAGADRFETSLELMRATRAVDATADTVFVATGAAFADALSAGPASWRLRAPVVLAAADGTLPEAAVEAIKADAGMRRVVLVGGTSAVSDAIRDQLGEGFAYERLGGADRYETSGLVARWSASHGLGWATPYVATGQGFADALAGAACAGRQSSCLLLADDSSTSALAVLKDNAQGVRSVTILGGTQAVSSSVERQVADAIG